MSCIAVLGSVALDNIFQVESVPERGQRVLGNCLGAYAGGMAANQALEAARYHPAVELIGAIGRDKAGAAVLDSLNSRHVGTNYLEIRDDVQTGQSFMYLVEDDYFSVVVQGANGALSKDLVVRALWELGGGFLLVSLETNCEAPIAALESARDAGFETFLVPSPMETCTERILDVADSLILNRRESQRLLGVRASSAEGLQDELGSLELRFKYLLVTMGSEGAVLKHNKRTHRMKGLPITALDSIGAGDALAGAFVAGLALGLPDEKALAFGCIAGGLAASQVGAQTSTHLAEDVERLYEEHYSR